MELRVYIFPGSEVTLQIGYIKITNASKSDIRNTTCGVSQGIIFGPLLFLVYVNYVLSSSKIFNPTMFAGDTNFFHKY